MNKTELVIWDMDGTLIDSASVVPDSFIATAARFGGVNSTRDEVIALYNVGVPEKMLERMLGSYPDQIVMQYFYETLKSGSSHVRAYDGIAECLAMLATKLRLAVFTGASQRSAEILLNSVGLADSFELIRGGDDYPPKPDPAGLTDVAFRLGVLPGRCVYIGDASADMQAASSAEMVSVGAGWGHLFSADSRPSHIADKPADVVRFV